MYLLMKSTITIAKLCYAPRANRTTQPITSFLMHSHNVCNHGRTKYIQNYLCMH